eukprot:gnl/Ergobibamus_cyprinoides/698.p1 GENE.gnl/Ergobibamus_cyprinoides/698~~gnl/Ergobibamus_cyprinoides/698.p1  ORF type:complete len:342 (+),score=89.78 gnl/Ergobibamus_cyprinoides/698:341-1366(+)
MAPPRSRLERSPTSPFSWGSDPAPLLATANGHKFDVVFLNDLLFNHAQHDALLDTLEAVLAPDATAFVVFSHHIPSRQDDDLLFFSKAQGRGTFAVSRYPDLKHDVQFETDTHLDRDDADTATRGTIKWYQMQLRDSSDENAAPVFTDFRELGSGASSPPSALSGPSGLPAPFVPSVSVHDMLAPIGPISRALAGIERRIAAPAMPAGAPGHDPNTLVLHKLVEMFVIARSNNMGGMAIVPCIREALAAIAQSCEIDTLLLSVEDEVAFNRDRPVLSALHRAIQSPDTELPLMAENILSPLLSRQPLFAPGQYADAAAAVIMIHLDAGPRGTRWAPGHFQY